MPPASSISFWISLRGRASLPVTQNFLPASGPSPPRRSSGSLRGHPPFAQLRRSAAACAGVGEPADRWRRRSPARPRRWPPPIARAPPARRRPARPAIRTGGRPPAPPPPRRAGCPGPPAAATASRPCAPCRSRPPGSRPTCAPCARPAPCPAGASLGGARRSTVRSKMSAGSLHQPLAHQLLRQHLADALDVHRPPVGEELDRPPALVRAGAVLAAQRHLARLAHQRRRRSSGHWVGTAMGRSSPVRRSASTSITWGMISPAFSTITRSPIFRSSRATSSQLNSEARLTVVPDRIDRIQDGHRGHRPGAPDVHLDVAHDGLGPLGRELVGDGPAGELRRHPQQPALGEGVDLDDQAVHLVGQRVLAVGPAGHGVGQRRRRPPPSPRREVGKPSSRSSASASLCRGTARSPSSSSYSSTFSGRRAASRASSSFSEPPAALRGFFQISSPAACRLRVHGGEVGLVHEHLAPHHHVDGLRQRARAASGWCAGCW